MPCRFPQLAGGVLSDRGRDRQALIVGLLLVSGAMGFWLLARPGDAAWLVGAYAVWGLFGLVNVCQRNLLLKSAAASDNIVPIAVLEHLGGLSPGLAGLAGGWLLDRLLARDVSRRPALAVLRDLSTLVARPSHGGTVVAADP